jgi:hypothetical protein
MMLRFLTISILLLPIQIANAQDLGGGSIQATLGNNIWGNTVGVGYQQPLSDHWGLEVIFTSGYFRFKTSNQGDFLFFYNLPGDEHRITLELKQLLDLAVYYRRNQQDAVRLFEQFDLGITHVFITFKSEFNKEGVVGTFKGERDYSKYGLFVSVDVAQFMLKEADKVVLSLGLRTKLILLDSPQTLDYDNNAGRIERHGLFSTEGRKLYLPYPEVFVSVAVKL